MKSLKYSLFAFVLSGLLFVACGSDDDDPTPTPPTTGGNCVVENITYASHIKAIVNSNCALSGCHVANTAQPDFTSYANLKRYADNGSIRNRVLVVKDMPKTGSLSACELDQIDAWLKNGAPEN